MMLACTVCRGDGFRVVNVTAHPATNVAGLIPHLDRSGHFTMWRGRCYACDGRGIIEWVRGGCLVPLIPPKGAPSDDGRD